MEEAKKAGMSEAAAAATVSSVTAAAATTNSSAKATAEVKIVKPTAEKAFKEMPKTELTQPASTTATPSSSVVSEAPKKI